MTIHLDSAQRTQPTQQTINVSDVGTRKAEDLASKNDANTTNGVQVSDHTASGTPAEVDAIMQHFVSSTSDAASSARRQLNTDGNFQIGARTSGGGVQGAGGSGGAR